MPCAAGGEPLRAAEIRALARQLRGRRVVKGRRLEKERSFDDFAQGLAFVDRVGRLADREGHHPDVVLKWGLVRFTLFTHSIGGLSESDFILAAKIDRLDRRAKIRA